MRLKSIKLAGFKSFVDPTTVSFSSNMSAIIGPNGCGKSNTIDAVRWVMGESSAKNLRGENMTDVIFNGSNARKPVGQATIELVFDNSDGTLTGEYARFSEISIKRKVTREAQNSYYLNGVKCRRRDITDIFLGTGLGPRSYAIIEQGMISKLIESKPEELRVFIEEAAGISKYKERRRDTENRMRRTHENLERLTDIREELERQLSHLKRQARAAEQYTEFRSQERLLKAQLQAIQWQQLDGLAGSQEDVVKQLEHSLEDVITERLAAESMIDAQRTQHTELTDQFNEVQGQFYTLGAEIARSEQNIQHQKQREAQLASDLHRVSASIEEVVEQLKLDEDELEQLNQELLEIEPELEMLSAGEEEAAEQLLHAEELMQQWQQAWDSFNQQAQQPRQQAEVQQSRIQHIEQVLRRIDLRVEKLSEEQKGLVSDGESEEIELLQEELAEIELQAESDQQLVDSLRQGMDKKREQSQQLVEELNRYREEYQAKKGRFSSLETLQQAALGQSGGVVSEWLADQALDKAARLGESLTTEPGFELAVETVLGNYLQAVCVDSIGSVSQALDQLSKGSIGFVVDNPQPQSTLPRLSASLLADKTSGFDVANLMSGVYVVDDVIQAQQLQPQLAAGESVVTKQGIWLGAQWLRVSKDDDKQSGVIARAKELEQLTERLSYLEQQIEQLGEQQGEQQASLKKAEQQRELLQQQLKQQSQQQSQLSAKYSGLQARLEQVVVRRDNIAAEIAEQQELQHVEQESLGEARLELQTALDAMENDAERREQLIAQRDSSRESLERMRHQARQNKDGAHQLEMRGQSLKTKISGIAQGLQRLMGQRSQYETNHAEIAESLAESRMPADEVQLELETALEQRLLVEEKLSKARESLDGVDSDMRRNEKKRGDCEEKAQQLRSELEKHRLEGQSFEVRRKALEDRLVEADFVLAEVLEGLPENAEEGRWQEDLQRIATRIQRLGAINLAAIEEYKTQSERKVYLDDQHNDLMEALESLESAIRRIDKETRSKFKETFDRVNNGLQNLFPKVFGGGSAYLELTGDDLLSTGITIMARPPGKRNSTIHLLSGGEKALTALALVFSIFQLNPAPFCMLDEVDAPLDDANVGRYANIVKEMSQTVQFIYITHNKIAMEKADQLMGVTMQEAGVSRLVTVDIEEAAELAAL
ncbi:Chromosome partition protein Smc [Sinobacterium norvegicum]|uniref:Chromosome partition protein Smc n=1 Tax=Sinobacterium norvegicum TaxID=1641715 RepID=A0ABM9AAY1_9GAMM|nr:chromosome segregation protein SMC [Sinobacterium norvegicum]CAH0990380.1 Chromosome partition protein Smc [Sinobacterium norvegicum]